ncbi:transcriptional regulator [Halalkalirubrum salinum]|uniref:transcriptional regulator n=1 Tax=Halalkalirubrum salinum TaxID=2563889 RepID=UPI0010FB9D14|nr:transcriptional regulator [Halalkalirubrum salinum]
MSEVTTRERVAALLREEPHTAPALSVALSLPVSTIYQDLQHVARSIDGDERDEQFLVSPPECANCGFSRFDDPINRPSRCPDCRSESIEEAVFVIRTVE